MGRFWPVLALGIFASLVSWIAARERVAAGERQTHVALNRLRPAVDRYLLEHEGGCPAQLSEVLEYLQAPELPEDAWGRPLRLVCPSLRPGIDYVLMSDGPDGKAGGLDRIEH
jgi:general secretion pathway protein G